VGIDIGTTSVKAVAVDAQGRIVDRARVPHPVVVSAPDHFEHDADRAWRRGPRRALKRLLPAGVGAVAVSSMLPSLTAVDDKGRPISPGLLYGDARGQTEESAAAKAAGNTADWDTLGFVRWTVGQVPGAAGYWPAPAVANFAIGGVGVLDIGSAMSSAPLFRKGTWDAERCASCSVEPGQLPRVEMLGAPIGKVAGTDVVLAAGGIDAMCEQMVAGADTPGDVLVICGTTLITWVMSGEDSRAPDKQATGLYTMPGLKPGLWVLGGPSNAGGLFLGWAARLGGQVRSDDRVDPHDLPVWLPYVRGERTPLHNPSLRASVHGLNLTHGPAALQRASWEAAGFVVRHHLDLAGVPAHRVVATGGGTRVAGWMQALADCTGLPVHVAEVPEGAALGAAYLARMALGLETSFDGAAGWARTGRIVDPDPAWVDPVSERYAVFRQLSDRSNLTPAS